MHAFIVELKSIKVDENNLRDIVNYAFILWMWCYLHINFFIWDSLLFG